MSHTRECTRCGDGTETCVFGNFYTCSLCDAETIDEPVETPTSYSGSFDVDMVAGSMENLTKKIREQVSQNLDYMNRHQHGSGGVGPSGPPSPSPTARIRKLAKSPGFGMYMPPFYPSLPPPAPVITPPMQGMDRTSMAHYYMHEIHRAFGKTKATLTNYRKMQAVLNSHGTDFLVRPAFVSQGPSLRAQMDWGTPMILDGRLPIDHDWLDEWKRAGL